MINARKDKGLAFLLGLLNLAGVAGLEPATIGFGDRCSTNWNYTPVDEGHYAKTSEKGKALFQQMPLTAAFSAKLATVIIQKLNYLTATVEHSGKSH